MLSGDGRALRRLPSCRLVLGACARVSLLAGCHGGIAPRPPVAASCRRRPDRRGDHHRGAPAEVAPLAVLEGTLDDPERTARTAQVATDLLHTHGYPRATIAVTRNAGCGVELAVAVDARAALHDRPIDVGADAALPPGEPRAALEDGLGMVNAVGGAYVEDRLARALGALVDRYRDAGWLDASADAPAATGTTPGTRCGSRCSCIPAGATGSAPCRRSRR